MLVVDDEPAVLRALSLLFEDRYDVLTAESAEAGVAALRDDVHVVVLDIRMKGRDGFWACNEMRRLRPDIPVIFYSAYQDAKDPFAIINEHRPFGYLVKDGNPSVLVDAVDTAARLYQVVIEARRLSSELERTAPKGP